MRIRLTPHPANIAAPVTSLSAEVGRDGDGLRLTYEVRGTVSTLRVPAPSAPLRTDGLWRATCFELFLKPGAGEAYYEFNFSPSSEWAAYRFVGYRRGMADAAILTPKIATAISGPTLKLTATIDIAALSVTPSARLGLAAVLDQKSGAKTYWSLAHGGDKPDFHRADGFIARLPFDGTT